MVPKMFAGVQWVSMYDHVLSAETLEMDACLTGLGAKWDQFVDQFPVPKNMGIVYMEMVNIAVALSAFGPM